MSLPSSVFRPSRSLVGYLAAATVFGVVLWSLHSEDDEIDRINDHERLTRVHTPLLYNSESDALHCDKLFVGDARAVKRAWDYTFNVDAVTQRLVAAVTNGMEAVTNGMEAATSGTDICSLLDELFNFHQTPLSQEEAAFPIAYGMLVYQNIVQILLELKSIYQPQNMYMIAVSNVTDKTVWNVLHRAQDCLPNVRVFPVPTITWCGPGVLTSQFETLQRLCKLNHPWRYYQFLAGVDVPLKTNLEMVRIFKAMDGAFDQYILPFQMERLENRKPEDSPIRPLYKSSLPVTLTREMANWVTRSKVVWNMVVYLNETTCADESLWGTVLFNGPKIGLPGGVDGEKWMAHEEEVQSKYRARGSLNHVRAQTRFALDPPGVYSVIPLDEYSIMGGYITRFQLWDEDKRIRCQGTFSSASCVFGIADLPMLRRQMQLVVHKMYLDTQPAAPICLWREIERRANERPHFDASEYKKLPLVQHHHGVPISQISVATPFMN